MASFSLHAIEYSLRTGGLTEQNQLSNELYIQVEQTAHVLTTDVVDFPLTKSFIRFLLPTNCFTHRIREGRWIKVRDLC